MVGALNYSEERFPKDAAYLPNDIVLPDIQISQTSSKFEE